mmetsp:Transcript_106987/g.287681  ORF Transcript_106987/g.287681 Transcript_106987/m.287681 type:complete len:158 (-) Transcript_106987:39-512(-)
MTTPRCRCAEPESEPETLQETTAKLLAILDQRSIEKLAAGLIQHGYVVLKEEAWPAPPPLGGVAAGLPVPAEVCCATSLIIRDLHLSCSRQGFMQKWLDEQGYCGKYDFLFPLADNGAFRTHVVVNFTMPMFAHLFMREMGGLLNVFYAGALTKPDR